MFLRLDGFLSSFHSLFPLPYLAASPQSDRSTAAARKALSHDTATPVLLVRPSQARIRGSCFVAPGRARFNKDQGQTAKATAVQLDEPWLGGNLGVLLALPSACHHPVSSAKSRPAGPIGKPVVPPPPASFDLFRLDQQRFIIPQPPVQVKTILVQTPDPPFAIPFLFSGSFWWSTEFLWDVAILSQYSQASRLFSLVFPHQRHSSAQHSTAQQHSAGEIQYQTTAFSILPFPQRPRVTVTDHGSTEVRASKPPSCLGCKVQQPSTTARSTTPSNPNLG